MPEVRLETRNQCLADGSSAEDEAAASAPSAPEPVAAFGGTDGVEGASNAGSDALVRRFEDGGAGGAPGTPGALSAKGLSCPKEDLGALVTCSGVLRAHGGLDKAAAALACVVSLIAVAECGSE